jgi:catecholate siderophore receptor
MPIDSYANNKPRQNVFNRTDLTYDWQMTEDIKHTLLAGAEFGNQISYDSRNRGFWNDPIPLRANRTLNVSVLQPTAYNPMYFTEMQRRRRTNLDLAAGYVQDQIALTKNVDLLAGVRFDSFNLKYQNNLNEDGQFVTGIGASYAQRLDNVWSPRFGLVIKPTDTLSFYATYSRSFLPAAGDQFTKLDGELVSGNVDPQRLAPQGFTNYELGFKSQLNPRLLFTGALYQLFRTNQIIEYVDDYNLQVDTLTKGGELGLVGNITDDWSVSWGYGIQNAKITNSDQSFTIGKTVPSVPLNTATFWSKYDLSSMMGFAPNTLGVGGGAIYNSSFFAAPDNAVQIPGYVRFDGAAYIKINDRISGQLNVENIGGAKYWVSAHRNNLITPGGPRSALLSVNVKF